ncbi:two-component system regulatory protein YycI [Aerococcus urinae]|uniref:Two-component system regulatory protein YycI n=1 Tax=Aerococcus urinae TaxID=1376 RepID=A0A0X8FDH9_9LACT|nr:two-component system regulatory protein YycI [Aerococcus urinae]AMB95262.1 hypothetical protein AWM73_01455 [Aerococcus urinae]MCY3031984.1 two-component system regulatory protein YycI [Aerococcus urinae]MCY3037023.1 two-component system regulatory protein YycI [Aerococcus urinae]MCY3044031.1 two-component system regulatory protein YycI [Aerococcus urinae]MCY3046742.1 two-component system regulatory protein YycI [Aerococcus urinae]
MNFRQIENILIIVFLALNIFLAYILFGKSFMETTSIQSNINIQQELKNNEVTMNFSPSSDDVQLPLIAGKQSRLSTDGGDRAKEQKLEWRDSTEELYGEFKNPIKLPALTENNVENPTQLSPEALKPIEDLLASGAIEHGQEYHFLIYNRQRKIIYYGQNTYADRLAMDSSAELLFHLNDQNEIVSYELSHVHDVSPQGEERPLITQKNAIDNLYLYNEIPSKANILSANICYQQTLSVDDIIVFKPVWAIMMQLDDHTTKTTFVDAINGTIVQNAPASQPVNPSSDGDKAGSQNRQAA